MMFGKSQKKPSPIEIEKKDIERRLGMEVDFNKFQDWMKRLCCQVKVHKEKAQVTPPFFRFDLKIKEDLIEEYARLEGYDKIPEKINYLSGAPREDQKEYKILSRIADTLEHEGFYQAINHSFISQKFSDSFLGLRKAPASSQQENAHSQKENASSQKENASSQQESACLLADKIPSFLWSESLNEENGKNISPVFVQNPLSAEYNMMRVSLAPSLFKNAQQSIRHGCSRGRLFELGKIFYRLENSQQPSALQKSPYGESGRLALAAWGQEENLWEKDKSRLCIYDLKTALGTLLESFGFSDYEWVSGSSPPDYAHPFQYIILKVGNKPVGYICSLHPVYAEKYKIRFNMALAEMKARVLFDCPSARRPFQALSAFPVVERDLSFLVPKDFPADRISAGIKKIAGSVCREVKIFDVYESQQKAASVERSVSFRLILQSDKETLTEEYLKNLQNKLTEELVSQYPVKLR